MYPVGSSDLSDVTCAGCGAVAPADTRFCGRCGELITAAVPDPGVPPSNEAPTDHFERSSAVAAQRSATRWYIVAAVAAVAAVGGVVAWPASGGGVVSTPWGVGSNAGAFPGPRVTQLAPDWAADVGETFDGAVATSPVIIGGSAVVTTPGGLYALDLEDGTVRWRLDVEAFGQPAVTVIPDSGRLAVVAHERFLVVDPDGQVVIDRPGQLRAEFGAAAADSGMLIVTGSVNGIGHVSGAQVQGANRQWEVRADTPYLDLPDGARPARLEVVDSSVAVVHWQVANRPQAVTAFDVASGELLWTMPDARLIGQARRDVILVRPVDARTQSGLSLVEVGGVDAVSGAPSWSLQLEMTEVTSGAVADDLVVVSDGSWVVAVDPERGLVPWQAEMEGRVRVGGVSPTQGGRRSVAVTSTTEGGSVEAVVLDATNGRERYRAPLDDRDDSRYADVSDRQVVFHDGTALWPVGADIVALPLGGPPERWRFDTSPSWGCSVTPFGDDIVVSSDAGHRRLDARNGTQRWSRGRDRILRSGSAGVAAVDGRLLHVDTRPGSEGRMPEVVSIDASSGEQLWASTLETTDGYPTPLVTDGEVVVVGVVDLEDGNRHTAISGFDVRTGDPLWQTPFPGHEVYEVQVADGLVLVPTHRGMTALDVSDGSQRWVTDHPTDRVVVPSDGSEVLLALNSIGVAAIDRRDGSRSWSVAVDELVLGPVVSGGTVVVAAERSLFALSTEDGSELWRTPLDNELRGRPSIVGGVVHVATSAGIATFDLLDGALLGTVPTDRAIVSPIVAAAGRLVACTAGDRLVAYR